MSTSAKSENMMGRDLLYNFSEGKIKKRKFYDAFSVCVINLLASRHQEIVEYAIV